MKTNLIFIQLFTLFLLCRTATLFAQGQVEIEHNSSGINPHIKLTETENDDFTRLFFENSNSTNRWAISSFLSSTSDNVIGFYYNGNSRMVYNETTGGLGIGTAYPEDLLHVVGGDVQISGTNPRLFLINDGAADARIGFGDNGSASDGGIWYDSGEDLMNFGTSTISGDIVVNGTGKVGVSEKNNLTAQMTIKANSGNATTPVQLELRENNNSDYARMRFSQFSSVDVMGYWDVAGKGEAQGSTVGDPKINFYYHDGTAGNNIMTIDGDDDRVGVNSEAPTGTLHLKQQNADDGLVIENNSDTDTWSFNIGANDLNFKFNGTVVGSWNDADGIYSPSDRRLKNNIQDIESNVLQRFMQLEPKSYFYNHVPDQDVPSYGYIAQDLITLFPNVVLAPDEESEFYRVNYDKVGVLTVKAVQELYHELEVKNTKIETLETQMAQLLSRIEAIETKLD